MLFSMLLGHSDCPCHQFDVLSIDFVCITNYFYDYYVVICCRQDSKLDERFHVELHFSPGVYNVGQNKEYLAGRGYCPQHGEKKQV